MKSVIQFSVPHFDQSDVPAVLSSTWKSVGFQSQTSSSLLLIKSVTLGSLEAKLKELKIK